MKNFTPDLISVIIPTFNSEKTIENCLKSILTQTHKNFELIIVDGSSTDQTIQKIKMCVPNEIKIQQISEADKGIYDAMNKGITKATGNWIMFLGSDDKIYQDDVFEQFIRETKQNEQTDVFYGNVYSSRFNGLYDGPFTKEKLLNKNICHQAILFKRSVFNQIGNFDLKYKALSDWDHNLRWFFSKKITNKYMDIIVAEYADGGFSSLNTDLKFFADKPFQFLRLGYATYSRGKKLLYLRTQIKAAIIEKDFKKAFKFLMQTPYIFY